MVAPKTISTKKRIKYGFYQFFDHFLGRKLSYKLSKRSRVKFYKNLEQELKSKGKGRVIPVDRVKNLSKEDFIKNYRDKKKPVIFEGAADNWDAIKNWSLDYFKDLHGDDKIVLADQLNIDNPYESTTLSKIIDDIKGETGKYYRFYPLLERHPEHILDFDYKWLRERRNPGTVFEAFQVFMGGDGTYTPLHNASQCNLFTQVSGEKEWRLYHYHDTAVLDPDPARNVYRDAPFKKAEGPFNPFKPDHSTPYNLFQYIDSYSVHLKPGDVFWNPPYYWHTVRNIGNSMGVGYRWLTPTYCFKSSFLYALLDCFVTNPPVWKAYRISKKDINFIHLAEKGRLEEYLNEGKETTSTRN